MTPIRKENQFPPFLFAPPNKGQTEKSKENKRESIEEVYKNVLECIFIYCIIIISYGCVQILFN